MHFVQKHVQSVLDYNMSSTTCSLWALLIFAWRAALVMSKTVRKSLVLSRCRSPSSRILCNSSLTVVLEALTPSWSKDPNRWTLCIRGMVVLFRMSERPGLVVPYDAFWTLLRIKNQNSLYFDGLSLLCVMQSLVFFVHTKNLRSTFDLSHLIITEAFIIFWCWNFVWGLFGDHVHIQDTFDEFNTILQIELHKLWHSIPMILTNWLWLFLQSVWLVPPFRVI